MSYDSIYSTSITRKSRSQRELNLQHNNFSDFRSRQFLIQNKNMQRVPPLGALCPLRAPCEISWQESVLSDIPINRFSFGWKHPRWNERHKAFGQSCRGGPKWASVTRRFHREHPERNPTSKCGLNPWQKRILKESYHRAAVHTSRNSLFFVSFCLSFDQISFVG